MQHLRTYNVCFVGRTGNGKSSLINNLWGTKFPTDPLVSCTKELYSVTVMSSLKEGYEAITTFDTPGIGEFSDDSEYEGYYQHAIGMADCIVLVTTFDRTDAPVQRFLRRIKNYTDPSKSIKLVIALNHIDSKVIMDKEATYQPWDESTNQPSDICRKNIETRINIIHQKFDGLLTSFEVVPVCSMRKYGLENLMNKILF